MKFGVKQSSWEKQNPGVNSKILNILTITFAAKVKAHRDQSMEKAI